MTGGVSAVVFDCNVFAQALLDDLLGFAARIDDPPKRYIHPIDPDDSPYVNLALEANAELIVSRDRHLWGLVDPSKPWADSFRASHPQLRVKTPDQFLASRA